MDFSGQDFAYNVNQIYLRRGTNYFDLKKSEG